MVSGLLIPGLPLAWMFITEPWHVGLINLAGETSLRETCALYRRTALLLTVDSSPIHIGAAAGVPKIVGVFGPTNEKQWGPHFSPGTGDFRPVFIDLPCRPCYAKVCSHNNCRMLLTAEPGHLSPRVKRDLPQSTLV